MISSVRDFVSLDTKEPGSSWLCFGDIQDSFRLLVSFELFVELCETNEIKSEMRMLGQHHKVFEAQLRH